MDHVNFITRSNYASKNKHFAFALGLLVITMSLLIYFFCIQLKIFAQYVQEKENLKQEFDMKKFVSQKKDMLEKYHAKIISTIEELDHQKHPISSLIEYIANTMPNDMYLTNYMMQKSTIEITGYTQSLNALHEFIAILKNNTLINSVKLTKTAQERVNQDTLIKFFVTFNTNTVKN